VTKEVKDGKIVEQSKPVTEEVFESSSKKPAKKEAVSSAPP
jgi:hypothetical protein